MLAIVQCISRDLDRAVLIRCEVSEHSGSVGQEVEVGKIGVLRRGDAATIRCWRLGRRRTSASSGSKVIAAGRFLNARLRSANRPRVEQQLRTLQHVAGIFPGRTAVEDVAKFVTDIAAREE